MDILFSEQFLIFAITMAFVNVVAAMSPGPDTLLIMRSSLRRGFLYALWVAIGIGAGILIHMAVMLSGMIYILQTMPIVLQMIGFAGAIYLSYLGYQCFTDTTIFDSSAVYKPDSEGTVDDKRGLEKYPFMIGFFTNILNPKAFVFFLGVMAPMLQDKTYVFDSLPAMIFLALLLAISVGGWFVVLSYGVGRPRFVAWFGSNSLLMNRITGATFVLYAVVMVYNALTP